MGPTDAAVRPRRSAFAAAFLSFLFPGLGHAYLGRWLRALLWAALPILGLAALAAVALSPDRSEIVFQLADPAVLSLVLGGIVIDLLYRLLALLDAYRLARDPGVGSSGTRLLSGAGLAAIVIVLLASHVAIARPVLLGIDTINDITGNAGDESEIADLEALAAENPDFVLNYQGLEQLMSPDPAASPGAIADATPSPTSVPAPGEVPAETTAAPEVDTTEWDGKKRLNVLLIGADGGRAGLYSYLTDTMIVVSIDPTTGRVAFISLPRDTINVPLPSSWPAARELGGTYNNKINTLYTIARGRPDLFPGTDKERGFNALMGALGELYGLDIDYYVAVDLDSFRSVVNTLGGVVVDVQLPVYDEGYPSDDGRGKIKLYVPPGVVKMNGQQALAYARSRHATSDFDRAARQQRVITSVRDQMDLASLFEPGVLNELIRQVRKDVKTNIPPKLVPKLLSLAQDIDLDRRENLVLSDGAGYASICYPCGPSGIWALKPNVPRIRAAVQDVFSNSREAARNINRLEEEGATVHVLNGQGGANTKALNIAAFLAGTGMAAVVPPVNDGKAETNDHVSTVITVYNGAADLMPQTFRRLKGAFKDDSREIVYIEDPEAAANFVITVGDETEQRKP